MRAINATYFQEFINNYKTKQEERANKGLGLEYFGPKEIQMLLDKMPIIEVEPVRHGRWIFDGAIYYDESEKCYDYQCSECGRFVSVRGGNLGKKELKEEYPYCHCGAKMDLKE